MAKKNWRESSGGASRPSRSRPSKSQPSATRNSGRAKSGGYGRLTQVLWLLAAAAALGFMINKFIVITPPETKTTMVFIPDHSGDRFLSNSPYQVELLNRFEQVGTQANENLTLKRSTFTALDGIKDLQASGPKSNVALFYIYADRFLAAADASETRVPTVCIGNAMDAASNLTLRDLLLKICKVDVQVNEAYRVVFLDSGRTHRLSLAGVLPGDFAAQAATVLNQLRTEQVENADRVLLMLSHGDYQLGWSAPELGNTVFGYFVSAALEGRADFNKDEVVDFDELYRFVSSGVKKWVSDFRDSVQIPVVIGLADGDSAASLQLIHKNESVLPRPDKLPLSRSEHESYWQTAYQLESPHARQMALGRLARLERLRYCETPEYKTVLQDLELLLEQAKPAARETESNASFYDSLTSVELDAVSNPRCRRELFGYLNPVVKEGDDPLPPGKKPELGDELRKLSEAQRALLLWEAVQNLSSTESWFQGPAFADSMDLAGGWNVANEHPLPDEWQYLLMLWRSVPWEKPDFRMSAVTSAVQVRHQSNLLVRGVLPSANGTQHYPGYRREWRLIADLFNQLETRRRTAEDLLINGQFAESQSQLGELQLEYTQLATQLSRLILARELAESSLAITPYVASFLVDDLICRRSTAADGPSEAQLERFTAAKALRDASVQILDALQNKDFRLVEQGYENAKSNAETLQRWFEKTIRDAQIEQSGSKYAYDAIRLIESPILEWLESTPSLTAGVRGKMMSALRATLERNRADFANGTNKNDGSTSSAGTPADPGKLHSFAQEWLLSARLVSETLGGSDVTTSWDQLQAKSKKVPDIEIWLTDRIEQAFENADAVVAEQARLESVRRELLKSIDYLLFGKEAIDLTDQRKWLTDFNFQIQLGKRSYLDLWGAGDAAESSNPPFLQYVQNHVGSAVKIADDLGKSKLGTKHTVPYDSQSLPAIANRMSESASVLADAIRDIQVVIDLNGAPAKSLEAVNPDHNNQIASTLATFHQLLESDAMFADSGGAPTVPAQNRWKLATRDQWSNSPVAVPELTHDLSVETHRIFRGHWFTASTTLTRMEIVQPDITKMKTSPRWLSPRTSTITVKNQERNTADLYFLLDCSSSMSKYKGKFEFEIGGKRETDRFEFMKSTIELTMRELVNHERFHLGVAAFGHRSNFYTNSEGYPNEIDKITKRFKYEGEVHPLLDVETAYPPTELTTGNTVEVLVDYVQSLQAKGDLTPLYMSIIESLSSFQSDRPKVLVVLTDGNDNQIRYWNETNYRPISEEPPMKLEDLAKKLEQYSDVKVLLLQINKDAEANKMPDSVETVRLSADNQVELKNAILDEVGRNLFSVTEADSQPSASDRKAIGSTVTVDVPKAKQVAVRTHEVGKKNKTSEIKLDLVGGEKILLVNGRNGMSFDRRQARIAQGEFLEPSIDAPVRLGDAEYRVGIMASNQPRQLRFGFYNTSRLSQFPKRVWALVKDDHGRQFQITECRLDYTAIPIVEFELPRGMNAQEVDVTLFIRPPGAEDEPETETHVFDKSEEYSGIQLKIQPVTDTDSLYSVELSADGSLDRPFEIRCPSSQRFGIKRVNFERELSFADQSRIGERFLFDIPDDRKIEFELVVGEGETVSEILKTLPKETGAGEGRDPIYGDDVVYLQFNGIVIRQ